MRPILKIRLSGGHAEENRAPVRDFILLVEHIQNLTIEEGKRIASGEVSDEVVEQSCQLDIVALSPGSLTCDLEPHVYSETDPNSLGVRALAEVIEVTNAMRTSEVTTKTEWGDETISEMEKVSSLLERGYEHIVLQLRTDGRVTEGIIDQEVRSKVLASQFPLIHVQDTAIKGILFELQDKPSERVRTYFEGHIYTETGEIWDVRFDRSLLDKVSQLWRRYVRLTGVATYYKAKRPKISAEQVEELKRLDFEEAIRRGFGAAKEVFGGIPFDELIRDLR